MIAQCLHADDDDDEKTYCSTSIDKIVGKVGSLAVDTKSRNSSERPMKSRMLQKLNARARQRRKSLHRKQPTRTKKFQKVGKDEQVSQQHLRQADDAHDVAEAKKTET